MIVCIRKSRLWNSLTRPAYGQCSSRGAGSVGAPDAAGLQQSVPASGEGGISWGYDQKQMCRAFRSGLGVWWLMDLFVALLSGHVWCYAR